MTATVLVFAVLVALFLWFVLGGRGPSHEPTLHRKANDDIDRSELEQAERDVREATDEESVREWGPGAGKPRPPEQL